MYAWIWRRLPFGLWGKLATSLGAVAAIAALLWFVVFPAVEPILPFNDGQISDTGDVGVQQPTDQGVPASGQPAGTGSPANPTPRPSR